MVRIPHNFCRFFFLGTSAIWFEPTDDRAASDGGSIFFSTLFRGRRSYFLFMVKFLFSIFRSKLCNGGGGISCSYIVKGTSGYCKMYSRLKNKTKSHSAESVTDWVCCSPPSFLSFPSKKSTGSCTNGFREWNGWLCTSRACFSCNFQSEPFLFLHHEIFSFLFLSYVYRIQIKKNIQMKKNEN